MSVLKDITTTKDGESFDVVRVAMAIIIFMLPFIMIWGLSMLTWSVFYGKTFDLQSAFNAVLTFLTGAGAFLMSGSASLYFKHKTEPDGTEVTTESIHKEN